MNISRDVVDFCAVTLNMFLARGFSVEFDQLLLGGFPHLPVVQSLLMKLLVVHLDALNFIIQTLVMRREFVTMSTEFIEASLHSISLLS